MGGGAGGEPPFLSLSPTILAVMLEMPMNKGIHANNESVRAKLLSFSLVAAA